jgi:DNA-binding LytR/AlgR family response regulator
MLDKITFMVVDDDRVDCLTLLAFLRRYPFMECIGDFASPVPALEAAITQLPDVLFLDIDMPDMSGLELRQQLLRVPACVFVTSFPEYALDAFELAAIDFLQKPFSADRFARTMDRIEEYIRIRRRSDQLSYTLGADTFFIKEGHKHVRVRMDDILYLEALNNYTGIITASEKYTVLKPISSLLKEGSFSRFIRIHRSFAVQKNFVTWIGSGEVQVHDKKLPVGRAYKDALNELHG